MSASAQLQNLNLAELYDGNNSLTPNTITLPTDLNDGRHYTTFEEKRGIVKWSFETGNEVETILDIHSLPDSLQDIQGYAFAPNEKLLLLETDSEFIYRRSAISRYVIYDLQNQTFQSIANGKKLQLAQFAPDNNKLLFVYENNIYYDDIPTHSQVQVTTDGRRNQIINGVPDWVYEEEFALEKAVWWSPDATQIAFLRFDERNVAEYPMIAYDTILYPEVYSYKYPKAGERNSVVSLHVYDLQQKQTKQMETGQEQDIYIPRVYWTPKATLCYLKENRLQNHLEICEADPKTGTTRVVIEDTDPCYIEEPTDWYITFLDDGNLFVFPSERDGNRQLFLATWDASKPPILITKGDDEIIECYGFSSKTKRLYYSAYDQSPLRSAIFSIKIDGTEKKKLSDQQGSNSAWFNRAMTYYIQTYSSVHTLPQISLHAISGKKLRVIEDNHLLSEKLQAIQLPKKEFFTFTTPEGLQLNGYRVLPIGFDSTKRYPVMMFQYSGPNSQRVLDKWKLGWDEYLASKGCLVVCVDGRGTGGRGTAFRKCTYRQLGNLETQDQLYAAEYLASLPYVDAKRMAIWGWSFGGYMSLLCNFRGNERFAFSIAVAPVTNWRFYDSIYTERFMGLPTDNAKGYDENSPIHFAQNLKGKLLIMHGTYDDNVHIQQSVRLVEKLVQENIPFDMQWYPDRNHNITGNGATLHLFTTMWNYIDREFFN